MKKITFKTNEEYFKFYNQFKDNIKIYEVKLTKTMKIRLFYDIM